MASKNIKNKKINILRKKIGRDWEQRIKRIGNKGRPDHKSSEKQNLRQTGK
ncbi:MAG: hypothetical protein NHB15_08780 [Methanosarcina barkeri]|nr:hypothetical protein [Methanosarcina sp. ERenArc_MAG2]